MKQNNDAYKVTILGGIINILLAVLKCAFGFIFHSSALISDGIHSLSDLISDFMVLFSIKISRKPKSTKYPYGIGKIESLTAFSIAILLALVSFELLKDAYIKISTHNFTQVSIYAIIAALISILSKEFIFRYTYRVGKRINSTSIVANAYHHRSDAVTSIAVAIGILCSYFGYPIFDPIASGVVSLFILHSAFEILSESSKELLDANIADKKILKTMIDTAAQIDGIKTIEDIRIRKYGQFYHAELVMVVEPNISVIKSVDIKDKLFYALKAIPYLDSVFISTKIEGQNNVEQIDDSNIFNEIKDIVYKNNNIIGLHNVVVEKSEEDIFVNIDIEVDKNLTVQEAHDIGEVVRDEIINKLHIKGVRFHIDPYDKEKEVNNRVFVKNV